MSCTRCFGRQFTVDDALDCLLFGDGQRPEHRHRFPEDLAPRAANEMVHFICGCYPMGGGEVFHNSDRDKAFDQAEEILKERARRSRQIAEGWTPPDLRVEELTTRLPNPGDTAIVKGFRITRLTEETK